MWILLLTTFCCKVFQKPFFYIAFQPDKSYFIGRNFIIYILEYLPDLWHDTCLTYYITQRTFHHKNLHALKLYIKYMVSIRCKMIVQQKLNKLGLHYCTVDLGEVDVKENITSKQREQLRILLLKAGLELMDDKKAVLIERIKNVIIEMVHYSEEVPKVKNSDFISEKLNHDYTYLANLFSEATGITIEQYIIAHKIERVKEFLLYDELNLTEISYKLNYSSVAHLSHQFKKVTGLTPTFYKHLKNKKRTALENV